MNKVSQNHWCMHHERRKIILPNKSHEIAFVVYTVYECGFEEKALISHTLIIRSFPTVRSKFKDSSTRIHVTGWRASNEIAKLLRLKR
ncbi:unnamed protein product [Schistosoma margrebowiei]|uniref:Uncharacterized protein n=1 Tax=Schistosoma margrebowiei TaxID=48269 RepID=A0A183NAX9_9TREM|nr:unnamed protein product [Schistosoma margrebowiei]